MRDKLGGAHEAYKGSQSLCAFDKDLLRTGLLLLQAFSLNAVNPTDVKPEGVARNFVSRDLLEARSLEDAVQVMIQRLWADSPEKVLSLLKS
jgi:hypothetical protein